MGKKRSHRSDSEESDADEDQAMNGDGDEEMEAESEGEDDRKLLSPSSQKKKEMLLRSGRRKRRRSVGTTGLTPPPTSKRARKKIKTTTEDNSVNGDKKPSSVTFTDSRVSKVNSKSEANGISENLSVDDDDSKTDSPMIAPDPRRISYSGAALNVTSNASDDQGESSSEEEDSDEIDVVPPEQIKQMNGAATQNDSKDVITEKSIPETDIQKEDEIRDDEVINADGSEDTNLASTGASVTVPTWQRLAIFFVLGYLSLLLSMPQVIKLTQNVVPLDDSILPPTPKLATNASSTDVEVNVDPSAALESWNKEFIDNFGKLQQAKTGYTSSKKSLEEYYDDLLNRVSSIAAQLQPRQKEMEIRLNNLNHLEELLKAVDIDNSNDIENEGEWDQARHLAQRLLGETLIATSSIELWDIQEDTDTDCDFELDEDDDNIDSTVDNNKETEPLLLASVLEEKISNLILRSTITAEKFIGGTVAEDRIRTWVKSRITEMIDNDTAMTEVIQEIEEYTQALSHAKPSTNTEQSDLQLSQTIESRLEINRADTTGVYDYASLKNGAEVIYGGKRGTSKSLIDELPVFNRILQNSNLRFYGFGPEAALTATYPPSSLGQCWSFRQTSLKEQLKERQLFENDKRVKNDFKRGNFGTLTIRLSEPISVQSIIIEHPPMRSTDQANSAIRKFRMVGYEDELATSKAWNLGSFEYNLKENRDNNKYLQTFEAATTVFGKEIPPLHSISLAVDSNHGHDYSCLYRFRVHGNKE